MRPYLKEPQMQTAISPKFFFCFQDNKYVIILSAFPPHWKCNEQAGGSLLLSQDPGSASSTGLYKVILKYSCSYLAMKPHWPSFVTILSSQEVPML